MLPLKFGPGRPQAALADRPLIWLLPFYLAGVALGWASWPSEAISPGWFLAGAPTLALPALLLRCRPFRAWPSLSILLLIPAVVSLGLGLTGRSLARPEAPDHILNYTADDDDNDGYPVILGGTVLEGSGGRPGQTYYLFLAAREIIRPGPEGALATTPVSGPTRLTVGGHLKVEVGDYLRAPVTLQPLAGFRNPGAPDPAQAWAARGLWAGGFIKSPSLVTSWPKAAPAGFLSRWRRASLQFIYERTPEPAAGLLAAQLAGQRGAVSEKSEETYRALGLSHILSVSGLHLAVWYGLCFWLARLGLRHLKSLTSRGLLAPASALLALIPALFYAGLAGSESPVIRAAVMMIAAAVSIPALRRNDPWNILAVAAWAILLAEPARLFTASFQLSFAATAALLAVFTPKPGARPGPVKAASRWPFLRDTGLAALAGTLGSAPLVIWHFGRLPLAGLAANLVFTPLLTALVLMPGLLSMAILPCSPGLASWPLAWAGHCQMGLMALLERLSELAGPGQLWPAPGPVFLAGYYLAGWVWLRSARPWPARLKLSLAILAAGLLPGLLAPLGERNILRFTVLDVGQGAAIHLQLPNGRQMLVDGGGSYNFDPGERIITPYLLRQGLQRLDLAVLTHPDQDHLKGLVSLTKNFRPREIWCAPWPPDYSPLYGRFLAASAASERTALKTLYQGRRFGPAEVRLLWPPPDYDWPEKTPSGDHWANDHSLALKISWGEATFLICGDLGPQVEAALVERYGAGLRAAVLVSPHHGSGQSLTPAFLARVRPQWVVFSVGRHNAFGLPHPAAVERARQSGAETWRTDRQGAAVFEVRERGGEVILTGPG
ncbi:MAG: DNA internalization-related competence protein ComEC/Rec2 [Candidatus Adiutrix sp.]|jgi:competence protein ComEC|nr:DNA internalization-related competence protein ComEC/Rec2 [Candidatus Adiutrix sp.]